MLTFFRRIRQSLLSSGNARKYILYAIGEIALVVIGILIALQINNWNEWRKDRTTENKVLRELQENLELNVYRIHMYLDYMDRWQVSGEIINAVIENGQEYNDSLDHHFQLALLNAANFRLSQAGYEALKNKGLDIIADDTLKHEIVYLFEDTYSVLFGRLIWGIQDNPVWDAYLTQHFLRQDVGIKPFDYDFIINDNYFKGLLSKAKAQRVFFKGFYTESLSETQKVLQLIKEELHGADRRKERQ